MRCEILDPENLGSFVNQGPLARRRALIFKNARLACGLELSEDVHLATLEARGAATARFLTSRTEGQAGPSSLFSPLLPSAHPTLLR